GGGGGRGDVDPLRLGAGGEHGLDLGGHARDLGRVGIGDAHRLELLDDLRWQVASAVEVPEDPGELLRQAVVVGGTRGVGVVAHAGRSPSPEKMFPMKTTTIGSGW